MSDEPQINDDPRAPGSGLPAPLNDPELVPGNAEHALTRRGFLQVTAASTLGAVAFTGCQFGAPVPRREFMAQSRVQLAEDTVSAYENWYGTVCRQCGAGCGVVVRVIEGRAKKLEGNPDHPVNRGKLCARGQAAVQEHYHPDRIQGPMRRRLPGTTRYLESTWDDVTTELVRNLRDIQQRNQAGQVVIITPPLRAHQALIVDRFTRAYGAQWLTCDVTGEAPLREAAQRALGQNTLPAFDIQNARYVLSFGADFLGTWLSPVHYGMQYGVFRQGNYRAGQFQPRQGRPRGYLVQVDPHFSTTASNADEWIPVRPGGEGALALSIAQVIVGERLGDATTATAFGSANALEAYQPERIAATTGVTAERIRQIARDFASRRPSLAIGGGLAGASTNGTETLAAVLGLNQLVGNLGREGGVRFNPAPPIEGLPTPRTAKLADWQALADRLRNGQVQAVLVFGANPVFGLPAALNFGEALKKAPFVVSFSSFRDETTELADLILPSHLQLEDWGDDVPEPGPGFPVLTVQQPVVKAAYDTRSFWDTLLNIAAELGGRVQQELPWPTYKAAIQEGARTLQQMRRGSVQEPDFDRFWMKLLQQGGWWDEGQRVPSTASAPSLQAVVSGMRPTRYEGDEREYPFHLVVFPHNTLGTGESAHLPWLQGAPDPVTSAAWQTWVELNPKVAKDRGLQEGDIVTLTSPQGRSLDVPVYVSPAAPPTVLAIPLGQGHKTYGRWAERRGVNPMELVAPLADETSGALAYAGTRVRMTPTGRRISLPKFEGTVPAYQVPGHEVAPVTRGET